MYRFYSFSLLFFVGTIVAGGCQEDQKGNRFSSQAASVVLMPATIDVPRNSLTLVEYAQFLRELPPEATAAREALRMIAKPLIGPANAKPKPFVRLTLEEYSLLYGLIPDDARSARKILRSVDPIRPGLITMSRSTWDHDYLPHLQELPPDLSFLASPDADEKSVSLTHEQLAVIKMYLPKEH